MLHEVTVPVAVTRLEVADHGELEADLVVYGEPVFATRRPGSWMILDGARVRELLPHYAARLEAEAQKRGLLDRNWNLIREED